MFDTRKTDTETIICVRRKHFLSFNYDVLIFLIVQIPEYELIKMSVCLVFGKGGFLPWKVKNRRNLTWSALLIAVISFVSLLLTSISKKLRCWKSVQPHPFNGLLRGNLWTQFISLTPEAIEKEWTVNCYIFCQARRKMFLWRISSVNSLYKMEK